MTAVEWLLQNIPDLGKYIPFGVSMDLHAKFQQALEIEKEQLEKEFERGFIKCADTLQFILDKGLTNNYKNETHDQRNTKPTI